MGHRGMGKLTKWLPNPIKFFGKSVAATCGRGIQLSRGQQYGAINTGDIMGAGAKAFGSVLNTRGKMGVAVRSILALVLREMATSYGRSPGGYLWAILQPVGGIAILTLIFSYAVTSPPLGSSFALFYAPGMLGLTAFLSVSQNVQSALRFSRGLLAYPNTSFMDALLARFLLAALTQALIFFVVLVGLALILDLYLMVDFAMLARGFGLVLLIGFAVGVTNCAVEAALPVWGQIWGIATRPLYIVSGIFFLIDAMPGGYREVLLWNPLAHVIMDLRAGLFGSYDAPYSDPVQVAMTGGVLTLFGLILLRRWHRLILE